MLVRRKLFTNVLGARSRLGTATALNLNYYSGCTYTGQPVPMERFVPNSIPSCCNSTRDWILPPLLHPKIFQPH
jgi:hypothetical protein